MKYGIDKETLNFIQYKIDKQRAFLESETFTTSTGQIKSLLEISFSANHSIRYYSRLANKLNTLEHFQIFSLDNIPVFLTITLDGFFRDFVKGNYDRFYSFSIEKRKSLLKKIPNNETYGFLRYKIYNKEAFSIRDCYKTLLYQWKLFISSSSFKKLRKSGYNYSYIRAVEPHNDGIPHFHIILYIPSLYLFDVKTDFEKNFPAPRNHQPLIIDKKYGKKCSLGQTYGFQWVLNNPTGYIMKYIQKSFRNLYENLPLTYLQSWYIKHRFPRIIISHSIVPQWVYQKMSLIEKNWLFLTEYAKLGFSEWSFDDDYIHIESLSGHFLEYDKGIYRKGYKDRIYFIKEYKKSK